MPLRRAHLGSLLVVVLALAGATAAPSRAFSRAETSITWAADDTQFAPARAQIKRRQGVLAATRPLHGSALTLRSVEPPVRHSLFQRPPPSSSNTRNF